MKRNDYIKTINKIRNELSLIEKSINSEPDFLEGFALYDENKENIIDTKTTLQYLEELADGNQSTKATSIYMNLDTFEKLDSLSSYIEATTSPNTTYNPDYLSEIEKNNFRDLTKSFKTKFITLAIEEALLKWEYEGNKNPKVQKLRYLGNKSKNEFYRSYLWEENGHYYGVTLDKRSFEREFLTTNPQNLNPEKIVGIKKISIGVPLYKIEEWFEEKKRLAEI
ncbi:hypothetical protein [Macrococcus equipercicus]|uniref:Uncharacterized protein n=1 Tax=Macrococcus equipercicus TaxID=69967 RepID=A0A9Q9F0P2_9STAP|nr:hypothetical protein [Macrococcus equipercicus]UTH13168.1 hypothetical protein KFV11_07805 [Macrococcus equipercicus]